MNVLFQPHLAQSNIKTMFLMLLRLFHYNYSVLYGTSRIEVSMFYFILAKTKAERKTELNEILLCRKINEAIAFF